MRHTCMQIVVALLVICVASSATAVTRDWNNPLGGSYGTTTNWTPNGVPGGSDTANFGLPNTYTVTLNTSTGVGALTQSQGDVTLNLNNQFLSTSTSNNILGTGALTSTLRINNGTFFPAGISVGGVTNSTSNLYVDTSSATTVNFNNFYVGTVGTGNLWIQNGALLTTASGAALGINTGSVGTATVTGSNPTTNVNSTWTINNFPLRVGGAGSGTLNILANGTVTAFGLEVGELLNSVGTVSMSGNNATFTTAGIANIGGAVGTSPAASATLNIGTGATMNLNGTTNLRTNAKINMNGGRLNLTTINVATGALVNWSSGTINFATAPTVTPSILDLLLTGTHTLGTNRTLSATAGTLSLTTPLVLTGGTISVPTLSIAANMDIGAFSTVTATNTVTLQPGSTVQLGNFATLNGTTSVTNNGGTLALAGPLANVTGPVANNAGYIHGTGRFVGGLNNNAGGTIRAESGDHLIIDTAGPTNAGTIELAGGTVEYSQALANSTTGTISGRGVFRASSATPGGTGINNSGVMSFSAGISDIYGDVNNAASGKIVAAGASTVTFFDDVVNNGDIRTVLGSRTVFFGAVSGAGTFTGGGTTEFEGDLKPGNSPANVTFGGNVVFGPSADTTIELGGATKGSQYDSLTIAGGVSLSGDLNIALINDFKPLPGQSFNILTAAGGIDGNFDASNLPALAGGLYFNLAYTATAINLSVAGMLGDYNKSGAIDTADYVLWRKTLGQSALAADGNNNGTIDLADFAIWRASYGASASGAGATAGLSSSAPNIPEPTSLLMILVATVCFTLRRRRARFCL